MKSAVFIFLAVFSLLPAFSATDAPIPRAPWKLELIATSPDIRHPSVVCAAPDGRIFVAEDPMDISAPANAPQGRIITFHPDGRRTIFATNLHAVFGLQYLEGKVFVVHNPKFTVFKDAGDVGTDPEDLIESTNPNPWALDWNDHVPANFKLAMDGYFYMAVGDKGIYNAKTKDGRTINLHGGGILRIKPDGTGAEIFSTGVRNILDVAITSEDEIFTYDNTDEHDWMGRLTHMVDGGFYGYPHDFVPRRPYTLWMMHDFGGGAATGTFANTEDALPPEYHDNLFLADFGKRQIIRVVVERDGATFKVAHHEELFSEMPDSFRPVGIAPSHDGKSIYICDWQHRDTKENVEVGRLWKLTYTGATFGKSKPDWYLPLALGKESNATIQQLSDGLAHPSRQVRLTAQLELSRRGEMPRRFTGDHPAASLHALWAWPFVPKDYTQLTRSAETALKRQQLRMFALHPRRDAPRLCIKYLKDPDASVRFHAATTLGRLNDDASGSISALLNALPEKDSFARFAIEKALNRLGQGHPKSWASIIDGLKNPRSEVRESVSHALRETYDTNLVSELQRLVRDSQSPDFSREAAIQVLASITRKLPEWKGEWWAYHPALALSPIKTISWDSSDSILSFLKQTLAVEPRLRLTTIRALTQAHETSVASGFRQIYSQVETSEVRREILRALAAFKDTNSPGLVLSALNSSAAELTKPALSLARYSHSPAVLAKLPEFIINTNLSAELRVEAIHTSGVLRDSNFVPALTAAMHSSDTRVRSAAIEALGKVGAPAATKALLSQLDSPSGINAPLAARALGQTKDTNAVPSLLLAYERDATREAALDALLEIPHVAATDIYLAALGNANPTTRNRARKVLEPFKEIALPAVRARIETMRPVEIAEIKRLYPDRPDLTLIMREKTIPTLIDYTNAGLNNKGDIERGRRIFHDRSGVACIKCHTVAGQGNAVGPDMTTVGAQFPRSALIEHILDPSKSVREGYQQVLIETSDDESYTGLIKSESADSLTILTAQATLQTIPKSKITSRHNSSLSLMPDGLHLGLSTNEFADLIAYLESLKIAQPSKAK